MWHLRPFARTVSSTSAARFCRQGCQGFGQGFQLQFRHASNVMLRPLQAVSAQLRQRVNQVTVVSWECSVASWLGAKFDLLSPDSSTCSPSMVTDGKTPKRQAAEAFLQSRFTPPAAYSERISKRRNISTSARVSACSTSSQADEPCSVSDWCSFDVCLPHVNWSTIASLPILETHNTVSPQHLRLPRYQLPFGIDIYLVDRTGQIPEALRLLSESMEDSVVSIDLEWKPDYVKDTSKVALMQLSSATCCLLIRICKLGPTLPDQLLHFLRSAATPALHCTAEQHA